MEPIYPVLFFNPFYLCALVPVLSPSGGYIQYQIPQFHFQFSWPVVHFQFSWPVVVIVPQPPQQSEQNQAVDDNQSYDAFENNTSGSEPVVNVQRQEGDVQSATGTISQNINYAFQQESVPEEEVKNIINSPPQFESQTNNQLPQQAGCFNNRNSHNTINSEETQSEVSESAFPSFTINTPNKAEGTNIEPLNIIDMQKESSKPDQMWNSDVEDILSMSSEKFDEFLEHVLPSTRTESRYTHIFNRNRFERLSSRPRDSSDTNNTIDSCEATAVLDSKDLDSLGATALFDREEIRRRY